MVSHLGQGLAVEDEDGATRLCHARRQLGPVAVGDLVQWVACGDDQGRVETVLPRRNLLTRPAHGGRVRPVAANLDRVFVVIAAEPTPDWLLVDQILAIARVRGIEAHLLRNKADLSLPPDVTEELAVYRAAGYPDLAVSARAVGGLDALNGLLRQGVSLFAGQSGVGKSSLTGVILPGREVRVGGLSTASGLGRHTTTTATLYRLPDGGALIDSPGVAIFGLADLTLAELARGFGEFGPHAARCRFNDCRHLDDAGCAVREAVARGEIHPNRHRRYARLVELLPRPAWQDGR